MCVTAVREKQYKTNENVEFFLLELKVSFNPSLLRFSALHAFQ